MNTPNSYNTIIRFDQAAEQSDGAITRIVGFVRAKNLLSLFDDATLGANPRSAKVNSVVADIIESVSETPDIFQFKTKGILLGTSDYRALDRSRFDLQFNDPACEGLLDGGHNLLALGKFILSHVMDARDLKKIKLWADMKEAWEEHRTEIKEIRDELSFKVPVELLVPSDLEDDELVTEFRMALLDICAARNNNAQLTQETRANQRGLYDEIRKRMPPEIAERVEWKSNEWESDDSRPIKVRDLVALSWIPLTVLDEAGLLPEKGETGSLSFSVVPQKIYSSKGEVSKLFDRLMEHPEVSKPKNGPRHEMHNPAIASAFEALAVLPKLYDYIFVNFGDAYNKQTGGKFGRIKAVKIPRRGKVISHYLQLESEYKVPDGFVLPILYGLKALLQVEGGLVKWITDPEVFLRENLATLVGAFKMPMEMAAFDPQKIAKSENSYRFMVGEVEKALLKQAAA